jgi:flagellar hook-length control protein FliK
LPGQPNDATVSVAKAVTATGPKADATATGAFQVTPDATAHGQQGHACEVPPPSADSAAAVATPAAPAATPTSPPAQNPVPEADRVLAATPTQPSRIRGIDLADRAIDDRETAVPVSAAIPPADASLQVEPAPAVTTIAPRYGADPRQARESPASAAQTIDVAPDARAVSPGEAAPSPPTATPPEASRTPPPAAPARQVLPAMVAVAIGGAGRITVTLEPGELGRVEISVERTADAPQVLILAERPETLALLQRDQRELDHALTQAGLQAEGRGVSFGLSGGDAGSGQPQRRRAPANGDDAARGVQSHDATGSIVAAPARRVTRSLLDLAI